jgi:hypothetical protein
MSSDHAEQGTLSYRFYALLKIIVHFVRTNRNKRERQKTRLVLIAMEHKQHVHTVRFLNQSLDPRDMTYDNKMAVQMYTYYIIQHSVSWYWAGNMHVPLLGCIRKE